VLRQAEEAEMIANAEKDVRSATSERLMSDQNGTVGQDLEDGEVEEGEEPAPKPRMLNGATRSKPAEARDQACPEHVAHFSLS
jgi:hypothetical protein